MGTKFGTARSVFVGCFCAAVGAGAWAFAAMATADSTLTLSRNVLIRPLIAPLLDLRMKLALASYTAKKLVMPNRCERSEDTLRARLAKAGQQLDGRASRWRSFR